MAPKIHGSSETPKSDTPKPAGWRAYRQEIVFLVTFVLILGGGFTLLSVNAVNDHVIEPFTAGIATVSGEALNVLGQGIVMEGTALRGKRFSVNIRNGCNGVETMIIFLAAVLAFPASWRSRLVGLGLGLLAIQAINLVRVVALFLTGAYFPSFFDSSHTVVWQTIVILFGVLLWIFWANRYALPPQAPATTE
ncbi:MAG: exosortase H [Thermoanaerobaculia bacterium]|nr:exosortase H [Thermoanaerobaculia bacterium]